MPKISAKRLQISLREASLAKLSELEKKKGVVVSAEGRRYVDEIISRAISDGSPDLRRIGEVTVVHVSNRGSGRFKKHRPSVSNRAKYYVDAPDEIISVVKQSVETVAITASQISRSSKIGVNGISAAIESNWCHIFPLCCHATAKTLRKTIVTRDIYA